MFSPTANSLFRFGLTILLSLACFQISASAQTGLREAANELSLKIHKDKDVEKLKGERILIAEFDNVTGKGDVVPRTLQEMLSTAFIKAKHFKVVERAQMEKALKELKLGLTDLIDPDNQKKIGKLVGASHILLGSISEGSTAVTIDARIVAIETGECIAAEDAVVNTDGKTLPNAQDANFPGIPKAKTPEINLDETGKPTGAGDWVGKKPDMGLFGRTRFKIAWREKLTPDKVLQFDSGDLLGDGTIRLVTVSLGYDSLRVWKWTGRKFQLTWKSNMNCRRLFVPPVPRGKSPIILYANEGTAYLLWNGTNYTDQYQLRDRSKLSVCHIIGWIFGTPLRFYDPMGTICGVKFDDLITDPLAWMDNGKPVFPRMHIEGVIADFDGDGNLEDAETVRDLNLTLDSDVSCPLEIFGTDGIRKGFSEKSYLSRLAVWNHGMFKLPFIVARSQVCDDKGETSGYVHFVWFDGETYNEVWKSTRFDDAVLDMKVCDPKGEGTDGLIILSRDKKSCYLSKIVLDK